MRVKRHRLLICLSMVIVVSTFIIVARGYEDVSAARIQQSLSQDIIRFHVRANSDSDEDQELKMKVKCATVTYMQSLLESSGSIDESRMILDEHIPDIRQTALDILSDNNSEYAVNVYFERSFFPIKSYGDVTFPAGEYEAFRIDIGESEGKNWWCVLYPPLCFVDATYGVLPQESKENLKNILTDDEYNAITNTQCKFRFKYLTFLNNILDNIDRAF